MQEVHQKCRNWNDVAGLTTPGFGIDVKLAQCEASRGPSTSSSITMLKGREGTTLEIADL